MAAMAWCPQPLSSLNARSRTDWQPQRLRALRSSHCSPARPRPWPWVPANGWEQQGACVGCKEIGDLSELWLQLGPNYGASGCSVVKNPLANAGKALNAGSEIPWRRKWQPSPIFLPGDPMVRGAWQTTILGVARVDATATKPLPSPPPILLPGKVHGQGSLQATQSISHKKRILLKHVRRQGPLNFWSFLRTALQTRLFQSTVLPPLSSAGIRPAFFVGIALPLPPTSSSFSLRRFP